MGFGVRGGWLPATIGALAVAVAAGPVAAAERSEPGLRYVAWSSPDGMMHTRVPAGWRVTGSPGMAPDLGQFRIEATSPDGRSYFTLAHNWLSFMEFQYGRYQPGAATVERIVLPQFLQSQPGYRAVRVTYRGAARRVNMPTSLGFAMPFDSGTLGFLLERHDGGFTAGTAFAETNYIASPGTPGLWRLRLFAAVLAPADDASQAQAREAVTTAFESLELSPQFFQVWNAAFQQTQRQMREYSAQMDRVFSRYLRSAGASASASGKDPLDGWSKMMRGGEYGENQETGESYWVSNDHDYWWVNDGGDVFGNDTGDVPLNRGNVHPLVLGP